MHCVRAIEHALYSFGEHGLPLIRKLWLEWRLQSVGIGGKRWKRMAGMVFNLRFTGLYSDLQSSRWYKRRWKIYGNDSKALSFFRGQHLWKRVVYTSFLWRWDKAQAASSEECKIDLIPQAFAAISKMPKKSKALSALNAAYDCCMMQDTRWYAFWPPFVDGEKDPGSY